MLPAQRIREKLSRGELVTGTLVTDHLWTDAVELHQRAGLDYLIADMEHGPAGPELVAEVCALGRRMNFAVFIRPRANDYATLRLAIDLGACGFLLSSVESAAEMDVVQQAVYAPPRGRRRPGGMGNRWVNGLTLPVWQAGVEDSFIVLPQIETRTGLANAVEIARHPLTTALAVGPYDLSAELGVMAQFKEPVLTEALQKLRQIAGDAGKQMWMIGNDVRQMITDGWRFLCVGELTWILQAALADRVSLGNATVSQPSPYQANQ